jgi:hypothetical protein
MSRRIARARDTKTHMLNPEGISMLAMRVADRVQTTIGDGRFPLVLRRRGRYGLAFIDLRPGRGPSVLSDLEGRRRKEAESMLRSILQTPRVARLDVTIFNRRLDPDGALANRLAALIAGGVASIRNVL